MGTSPISSLPYVLSLFTPYTIGQYTIAMNLLFIVLEMVMMKRSEIKKKKYELMSQIPISICFGLFIDISMHYLIGWLNPDFYLAKLVSLLVGCFLLGVGISLEVKASVSMVTGEYLVQVISKFVKRDFGFVKVCFDVTLVVISCILSLCFMHKIDGLREGTVAAALLVGPISHFMLPCWRIFDNWLNCDATNEEVTTETKSHPLVITITREYGSGGHQLGEMLSKTLGIKYYDKSLISLAAKESRLSEKYVSENEQRIPTYSFLDLIFLDYESPEVKSLSPSDAIFVAQSRIIRKIVCNEPCIIIGRCADFVLKDYPPESIIRVFCYTDIKNASKRCMNESGIESQNIMSDIEEKNRSRINHYQYYTRRKWGDPHNYDIMINTGCIGIDAASKLVAQLYEEKKSLL